MINLLDILDLRLKVTQISNDIPDILISKILDDEIFDNMIKGGDILYIIERCFHHLKLDKYSFEEIEIWASERINQLIRLSRFEYNDNEKLILFKYLFYKYCLTGNDITLEKLDIYVKDIDNILSIQINEKNGIWVAKEELRLVVLQMFAMNIFEDKYINFLENQLFIARANSEERQRLSDQYLNITVNSN